MGHYTRYEYTGLQYIFVGFTEDNQRVWYCKSRRELKVFDGNKSPYAIHRTCLHNDTIEFKHLHRTDIRPYFHRSFKTLYGLLQKHRYLTTKLRLKEAREINIDYISSMINLIICNRCKSKKNERIQTMATYKKSNGNRIEKSLIDKKVRVSKFEKLEQMRIEYGYIFCENCGKNENCGEPLDCSHDISVDKCQKIGRSELAYDVNNITIRCRSCHRKHDKTN